MKGFLLSTIRQRCASTDLGGHPLVAVDKPSTRRAVPNAATFAVACYSARHAADDAPDRSFPRSERPGLECLRRRHRAGRPHLRGQDRADAAVTAADWALVISIVDVARSAQKC